MDEASSLATERSTFLTWTK